MTTHIRQIGLIAAAIALLPATVLADSTLKLSKLGAVAIPGAEISAYDPFTRRVFATDSAGKKVHIIDARDPAHLVPVGVIDVAALGSPNSVAVNRGLVAVAIQSNDKVSPGKVGLYLTDGSLQATVAVGSLPDMVTFTPNGQTLLVANEGEPNSYNQPDSVDPVGSVSIIRLNGRPRPGLKAQTVDFSAWNGRENELRAQGIRIYGPNANAAKDLEPEYIAVSEDSRTAYVTLQENNAVAKIDIGTGAITSLLPLGFKDYRRTPRATATYEWPAQDLPVIGTIRNSPVLRLGGFSGLFYEGVTNDGELKFIANIDRGPNGEPLSTGERPFLLPSYTPRLVRFTLDPWSGKLNLTQQILLRNSDGRPLTGLPNTTFAGSNPNAANNDEVPIDLKGNVLPLDMLGGDFEGIVVAEDGTFWLPDEYRPALYHFDARGKLLHRYIPKGAHAAAGLAAPAFGVAGALGTEALPAVLGQRRQNRGMEGIAIRDGKIYGFIQSPIRNPVSSTNGALNARQPVRIVELDPVTLATRQFLYIMDNPAPLNAADTRADKIGDAVATPEGFLVLERDDDALPVSPLEVISKKIYAFSLNGATPITEANDILYAGKTLDQMSLAELGAAGIAPVTKTLDVDLAAAGYNGVQKVEGMALLGDGRLAVVNDNDFQVAQIAIDWTQGTYQRQPTYAPESTVIGLIDRLGLDASDRDGPSNGGRINIRPSPVFGMYQPDAIASYKAGGRDYFVTVNEGDARDWPGFTEEARVSSLTLDPGAFPNAATLKNNANLGRLNVTRALGDVDGDGDFDALYTLGGRSFSIWTSSGVLVFDSGSALERITSIELPSLFNAGHDDPVFDSRSDNKGPEPEALTIGEIQGRTYAFVGLERAGGIAVFDITHPGVPVFVDYLNDRTTGPAETRDIGPEGLEFIPARESPTGRPLLMVTSEISNTVSLYAVTEWSRDNDRDWWDGDRWRSGNWSWGRGRDSWRD
jgi:hypothetical protein